MQPPICLSQDCTTTIDQLKLELEEVRLSLARVRLMITYTRLLEQTSRQLSTLVSMLSPLSYCSRLTVFRGYAQQKQLVEQRKRTCAICSTDECKYPVQLADNENVQTCTSSHSYCFECVLNMHNAALRVDANGMLYVVYANLKCCLCREPGTLLLACVLHCDLFTDASCFLQPVRRRSL